MHYMTCRLLHHCMICATVHHCMIVMICRTYRRCKTVSKIIAVANQKGGVGKTEIAIHLAAALSRTDPDAHVLLVDLDPQGHTTEGVGLKELYDNQSVSLFDGLTKMGV